MSRVLRAALPLLLAAPLALPVPVAAAENVVTGILDLRLFSSSSGRVWLDGGLDKQRFAGDDEPLRLGAAVLDYRGLWTPWLGAHVVANASDGRGSLIDLAEAYLDLHPAPRSALRWRGRIGVFYPPVSLENVDVGWTSPYSLSWSAIDSWIGEEIRARGAEIELTRLGRLTGSANDVGLTLAAFRGNDPAGALISWRGWALHDRPTGLFEKLPLAALPAFAPGGSYFPVQGAFEKPFVEIDGRTGWYADAHWSWLDRSRLRFLHYDNRGDATVIANGQWTWSTRFDHVGWQFRPAAGLDLLVQALDGDTEMDGFTGPLVYAHFRAAYLLASREWGPHRFSVRFDRFEVRDEDTTRDDPNQEHGSAWMAAYFYALPEGSLRLPGSWRAGAELLQVESERPARRLIGEPEHRRESSGQLSLRVRF